VSRRFFFEATMAKNPVPEEPWELEENDPNETVATAAAVAGS
jgi:hypothetical protein